YTPPCWPDQGKARRACTRYAAHVQSSKKRKIIPWAPPACATTCRDVALAFYHCVGGMVVNGLKVFGTDPEAGNPLNRLDLNGDITDQIFDKLGVVIGVFGHVLFVGTLEQAPQLT